MGARTESVRVGPTAAQIAVIRGFDFLIAARWPTAITLTAWTAIPYLAGRDTKAVFLVLFREIGSFDAVPWIVAALATAWALGERWLRRRTVAYLSSKIRDFDTQVTPTKAEPRRDSRLR